MYINKKLLNHQKIDELFLIGVMNIYKLLFVP